MGQGSRVLQRGCGVWRCEMETDRQHHTSGLSVQVLAAGCRVWWVSGFQVLEQHQQQQQQGQNTPPPHTERSAGRLETLWWRPVRSAVSVQVDNNTACSDCSVHVSHVSRHYRVIVQWHSLKLNCIKVAVCFVTPYPGLPRARSH